MTHVLRFLLVMILSGPVTARAQGHDHGAMPHGGGGGACSEPRLACAGTVSPFVTPDGAVWIVWTAGGRVLVARSGDKGATFGDPVAVTPEPVRIDEGPDSRPQIVVDQAGRVTVAFAIFRDDRWNGQVLVSRSTDQGQHFSVPEPITADSPSERFQGMAVDGDGRVFAAWLDKRDAVAARARGEKYPGAALAFAWSGPSGAGFAPARIAADDTCECCRLGIGFAAPGRPVVAFRNIFAPNFRDHAVVVFQDHDTPGPVRRVSEDQWAIDGCPHHGPSLAAGASGALHVAWFTGGGVRKGLFYAHSFDQGAHFSEPMAIGAANRQNGRPYLMEAVGTLYLAWKSFDGQTTEVRLMTSHDQGTNWSAPVTVATTSDASDHPLLVHDGASAYLSWMTAREGYRLIAVRPES